MKRTHYLDEHVKVIIQDLVHVSRFHELERSEIAMNDTKYHPVKSPVIFHDFFET